MPADFDDITYPLPADAPDGPGAFLEAIKDISGRLPRQAASFAALPTTGNFVGRIISTADTNTVYLLMTLPSVWVAVAGMPAVSTITPDASATVDQSKVQRSFDGVVTATWQQTRTASTTYAASLIVGVLPVGFRPVGLSNPIGGSATFGGGTAIQCIAGSDGIVRLTSPSPAGHTVARSTLSFMIF